jgi:hypothetical protein
VSIASTELWKNTKKELGAVIFLVGENYKVFTSYEKGPVFVGAGITRTAAIDAID